MYKRSTLAQPFIWAPAALLISALILLIGYSFIVSPAEKNQSNELVFNGKQLTAVQGEITARGTHAIITAAAGSNAASGAVNTQFIAKDYPFLSYKLNGRAPTTQAFLIWRTTTNQGTFNLPLPWKDNGETTIDLTHVAQWQGTIAGIGLYVGNLKADEAIELEAMRFRAPGPEAYLDSTLSAWTLFRGWTGKSINALYGSSTNPAISPTKAIGAWAVLALLILCVIHKWKSAQPLASFVAVFLIPWITLDLFWQSNLQQQVAFTQRNFSGKTTHEKHLVDADSPIYIYAQRLSENIFPDEPARIFILHPSKSHNFLRLKTQFYLLPHNVYNYGSTPPIGSVRPGDYLIDLSKEPVIRFNDDATLSWEGEKHLAVDLLDTDPLGKTYRVVANLELDHDK